MGAPRKPPEPAGWGPLFQMSALSVCVVLLLLPGNFEMPSSDRAGFALILTLAVICVYLFEIEPFQGWPLTIELGLVRPTRRSAWAAIVGRPPRAYRVEELVVRSIKWIPRGRPGSAYFQLLIEGPHRKKFRVDNRIERQRAYDLLDALVAVGSFSISPELERSIQFWNPSTEQWERR